MILKKKIVVENECEPKLGYKMISINDYQKKNIYISINLLFFFWRIDKHKPGRLAILVKGLNYRLCYSHFLTSIILCKLRIRYYIICGCSLMYVSSKYHFSTGTTINLNYGDESQYWIIVHFDSSSARTFGELKPKD